ncbi:MAG: ribosome assembly RNA-binding protein YhbY, partial [Ectopseudomonas oleovorans]
NDHELIKVQLRLTEREDRQAAIAALCASGRAELVQSIGKVALLYRKNPKPNRNLSNVIRYQG